MKDIKDLIHCSQLISRQKGEMRQLRRYIKKRRVQLKVSKCIFKLKVDTVTTDAFKRKKGDNNNKVRIFLLNFNKKEDYYFLSPFLIILYLQPLIIIS